MGTIPAFADLQNKKNELIRKGLEGSVFGAEMSVPALTQSTVLDMFDPDSGELLAFPSGYRDVGYTSEDGAQWSRSVDTSDTTSWGTTENTRSDITSDVTTLQLACQETNAQTIAQYMGVKVSSMVPAANGTLFVPKPSVGSSQYRRVFAIAVDVGDGGEIYIIRTLPRAKVTDYDDSPFNNGDDPIMWPVTYTGYRDSTAGFSDAFAFGGPGWLALLGDMGFGSITVSPATASLTATETQQLTVTDESGADVTASSTFASADQSVATVSGSGLVTAVGSGTTTITATRGTSASMTVTVT